MINRGGIIFLIFLMAACSKSTEDLQSFNFKITDPSQTWELYQMSGGLSGELTSGEEMAWQEFYVFRSDSTFSKTRITDGLKLLGEGTFTMVDDSNESGLLLNYTSETVDQIVGNCSGDNSEYLYLDSGGDTLLSSWWACDGPGLFYRRQN